ncbi:MAG: AAA family ATPase, partial [Anaerolineae bacterium]|nr:AAA family ATPase [Anaerolineae bacterium]
MAKTRTRYVCQNCGKQTPRYFGRCPNCNEFNTMVEETIEIARPSAAKGMAAQRTALPTTAPQRLGDVRAEHIPRLQTPSVEFNRVLGGGIVPGSIVLIGGDPGIGKSTLLLQSSAGLAQAAGRVLYVSGEESTHQIKMRADRMGLHADELYLLTETNLSDILHHVSRIEPALLVIDSIQTVYSEESESSPGSVSQ